MLSRANNKLPNKQISATGKISNNQPNNQPYSFRTEIFKETSQNYKERYIINIKVEANEMRVRR